METTKMCKTAELIVKYGNKKVKRYVARHKVVYTRYSYRIAAKLPSIIEAQDYLEATEISVRETIRLCRLYNQTCRDLLRRLKYDTKRKEVE